jgi:hypothetical protein
MMVVRLFPIVSGSSIDSRLLISGSVVQVHHGSLNFTVS